MVKKIVIIGGGFAGINLVNNLKKGEYHITLVDRNNYLFFPPLLYQVATGFLEPSNISYPYRKMFQNKSFIRFKMGEVVRIMPNEKRIILTTGELYYDYLVLATGTKTNYFGLENVKGKAVPMKNIDDALEMRNYILEQLERATTLYSDQRELRKALTIVIAGGGPTGVEISGMLAEMKSSVFKKDYPELNRIGVSGNIYLIDGAPQLLTPMHKKSQDSTHKALEKMGVNIILNTTVKDYYDDKVFLSNGEIIETKNLIWAAGVVSQTFDGLSMECYGKGKRLITNAYHQVLGYSNIYAIGDTCIQMNDQKFPQGHPQVAQVALQQGKNLAHNFNLLPKNKSLRPFSYHDKGAMAIIGRNKAVADLSNLSFKGFTAWCIWIFIHLISLVHYRNRITTLYNWIVSYITKDQALRMIIRPKR
ncbi:NAD(P)/FAD-dependent oxidoreductase [Elizabethkingia anophelis]|uniref:NAD(P)/FAD-dependent oxidoreductase n=1 Tax=Elizabethkingia anophelis TaxID=1117645 RepID=UPI00136BFF77|nr:NAD(P)/FAD-dependent oxidoreductase [Elizabethkingia anophelis]MYY25919.1 NAD(P)/FAD-dependent oxidoreductase [Elizabethkingia anophelis]